MRHEADVGHSATVRHGACRRAAGQPADYRGESASADDPGWFFAEGAHDLREPVPPTMTGHDVT